MLGRRADLLVVGVGIRPGHLTREAQAAIQQADVVLGLIAGALSDQLLRILGKEVVLLNKCYVEGEDRQVAYQRMADQVVAEIEQGKRVCMAVYGHPGVYCMPAHWAVASARAKGFCAKILPGISADATLFADLGIDPGMSGCQGYEATYFLLYDKMWDPTSYLLLWQIGLVGNFTYEHSYDNRGLLALREKLLRAYEPNHLVTAYFSSEIVFAEPAIVEFPIGDLQSADFNQLSTLVVPPAREAGADFLSVNQFRASESARNR